MVTLIYLFIFTFSAFLALLAFDNRLDKGKLLRCISACLSVGVLSILNWIRDSSIGTDVEIYGNAIFGAACNSPDLLSFLNYCNDVSMKEIGYALLNYAISRVTTNVHVYYGILGLVVNGIFFYAIYLLKEHNTGVVSWILYMLLVYPSTLNLIRQGIALSIVALAVVFVICHKNPAISVALLFLAYSFHHSSILAALILAFVLILERLKSQKGQNVLIILFLLVTASLLPLINFAYNRGYLSDKYSQYMNFGDQASSLANAMLIRLPFVVLSIWALVKTRKQRRGFESASWAIIIGEMELVPLQSISRSIARIALYYGVFKIFGYVSAGQSIKLSRKISDMIVIAYAIVCFYIQVVLGGANQIYPFIVATDNIL